MTIAKKLLDRYIDYRYNWDTDYRRESEPAQVRIAQMKAMLHAVGIQKGSIEPKWSAGRDFEWGNEEFSTELDFFRSGRFVYCRDKADYAPLIADIFASYKDSDEAFYAEFKEKIRLDDLFRKLLEKRLEMEKVLGNGFVVMEGFDFCMHYYFTVMQDFRASVRAHFPILEKVLCEIIDPQHRAFNQEQLVNEFGFPKEDLRAVDYEWEDMNLF